MLCGAFLPGWVTICQIFLPKPEVGNDRFSLFELHAYELSELPQLLH
jgi:hypothetical protein